MRDSYLEYIYGEFELFKDELPEGWSVCYRGVDGRHVVLLRADGAYSVAECIDTAKIDKSLADSKMPHINLDEHFIFYIVDSNKCITIDKAKARMQEWVDVKNKRIEKRLKETIEEIRRSWRKGS